MPSESRSHSDWIDEARREFENCAAGSRTATFLHMGLVEGPPPELMRTLAQELPGYEMVGPLARGGQGLVLRAVQRATGREVAIKVLRAGALGTPQSRARFDREVQILGQLKHPNIVSIIDRGSAAGHEYFIMDYVRGSSLIEFVREHSLDVRSVLSLFVKLCDALSATHLRGIIHRDLKPANIRVDPSGEPHLLDFGLAKVNPDDVLFGASAHQTETGQFVGSLHYAAPEQFHGAPDDVDLRTDVYALGVMLFQALTGALPHKVDGSLHAAIERIVKEEPPHPSRLNHEVRGDVDAIVRKCLAKEPEDRYQSAGELARELRRYLRGEPIEARRDSLVYVMAKQLARYRVASIAIALVLTAVLAALVISLRFWHTAERQRAAAQKNALAAQAAAERADREADQSRAVLDFMRGVLTSVEPDKGGADVRLAQVLAAAAATAPERFAGHPFQEAELHELLARVYDQLALWPEAVAEYGRQVALLKQHAGTDDPRTLRAESNCAGVTLNLSNFREAEETLTALLPRMERTLGADDHATLAARRSLAIAMLNQGRVDEAEQILRALRANPAIADDDQLQMRIDQSLIDVLEWHIASAPHNTERERYYAEQESLARDWLARAGRQFAPQSGMVLQARLRLAQAQSARGNQADAIACCRSVLDDVGARLPECHDLRAYAMSVLAQALSRSGVTAEPVDLYLRRIECLRQAGRGARAALFAAISDALGFIERDGRAKVGEQLALELADVMAKFGHDLDFAAALYVARFRSMQGRFDEAQADFESLFAREAQTSAAGYRARLHLFFAHHLILLQHFDQAEAELDKAASIVDDIRHGTRETHPDDILQGYIALYEAVGDLEKAEKYRGLCGTLDSRPATMPAAPRS